jgi:hypothetical protein
MLTGDSTRVFEEVSEDVRRQVRPDQGANHLTLISVQTTHPAA